jgi:regulator of RNase E activity RraA
VLEFLGGPGEGGLVAGQDAGDIDDWNFVHDATLRANDGPPRIARYAMKGEMPEMTELSDDVFAELRKIDTPAITNVVATYPKNPLCLGLYNPWTENWYTDTSIRCIYPELGPTVGYAVTCVYGMPDPNYSGRLSFMDVLDALEAMREAMKKPTVLVIQQKWPEEIIKKAGLAGEMMVSSMMAVGCIGMLSNGPSRDVDAIRKLKFQYMLGGVTAGHGEMAVQAINVPVSVGGMDVAPGELIHMDENGAVKFPPHHAPAVIENAKAMLDDEARRLEIIRKAKTAAEVRAANSGGAYTNKKA